jgi:uncharacterized membrane-anchored protein
MKSTWVRALIALGAALVLVAVNLAIAAKERIKRDGEIVYLLLAPVDPRSLMQGDYMALRFALVREIERSAAVPRREGEVGRAAITLDAQRVARLAEASAGTGTDASTDVSTDARTNQSAVQSAGKRVGNGAPLALRYRIRGGQVWLGTNAFFFEEGSAARFSGARYGEFRVDRESGEAVLVGLRDAALKAM